MVQQWLSDSHGCASISITFSCKTETLCIKPSFSTLPLSPWHPPFYFLPVSDFLRALRQGKSCSSCLSLSGLFHGTSCPTRPGVVWAWPRCGAPAPEVLASQTTWGPWCSPSRDSVCVCVTVFIVGTRAMSPGLRQTLKGYSGGGGVLDTVSCSSWEHQSLGSGGPGAGVPETYRNFLMFFSDTRTKSTMG